jgi:choline dehydrogenase
MSQNLLVFAPDGPTRSAEGQTTVSSIAEMQALDGPTVPTTFDTGSLVLVTNDTMNNLYVLIRTSMIPIVPGDDAVVTAPNGGQFVLMMSLPAPGGASDYLILGYGTSGATLAKFLTDDLVTSVTVLEIGDNNTADAAITQGAPFGDLSIATDPKYSNAFYTVPGDPNPFHPTFFPTGFIPFMLSTGKGWGGGSSHNFQQAVRGTPDRIDTWSLAGGPGYLYTALLPVMKVAETYTPNSAGSVDAAQRGTSGPLSISQWANDTTVPGVAFYNALTTAINAPAYVAGADYNDGGVHTVGAFATQWYSTPGFPPNNARSSSATAFANATIVTPGGAGVGGRKLTVVNRVKVLKLLFDTSGSEPICRGALCAKVDQPSVQFQVFATKEIISCLGTIGDSALLELSGIGDAANVLTPLKIDVLVDNPNVGANFHAHPTLTASIPLGGAINQFEVFSAYSDLSGAAPHDGAGPVPAPERCSFRRARLSPRNLRRPSRPRSGREGSSCSRFVRRAVGRFISPRRTRGIIRTSTTTSMRRPRISRTSFNSSRWSRTSRCSGRR